MDLWTVRPWRTGSPYGQTASGLTTGLPSDHKPTGQRTQKIVLLKFKEISRKNARLVIGQQRYMR